MYDAARGAKMTIQEISNVTDRQNTISGLEDDLTNVILTRMDQLYEQVAKELDKANNQSPQEKENGGHGHKQTQEEEEMDMEEELKRMMLTKMKEMYDRVMNGDMNDFVDYNQKQLFRGTVIIELEWRNLWTTFCPRKVKK